MHLPPGSEVDFETFEQHIQRGDYETALILYQGELLPEDRYQDWTSWKREQLAQKFLKALLTVAEQKLAAGQPAEALEACHRILNEDPWCEPAVLVGMQACIQLKDRFEAIRLYQEFERRCAEELGVSPLPETQELYHSLF